MLTLDDCAGFCHLTDDEVAAIAEHEHIPTIVAMEMGEAMLEDPKGCQIIRRFIEDDLDHAKKRGDTTHVKELQRTLARFTSAHRRELAN